jgi:hypothetical protein
VGAASIHRRSPTIDVTPTRKFAEATVDLGREKRANIALADRCVVLQTMADDARSAQEDLAKSVQAVAPAAPQSSGGKTKIKKTHAAEIETMKKEHEKTRDALLKAAKDLQDALAIKSKELITANKDLAIPGLHALHAKFVARGAAAGDCRRCRADPARDDTCRGRERPQTSPTEPRGLGCASGARRA